MKWGVTKVKYPNKGHTPNKGQKPMYQDVCYLESPLYSVWPWHIMDAWTSLSRYAFIEVYGHAYSDNT